MTTPTQRALSITGECNCDVAYKSRQLKDPQCDYCENYYFIVEVIQEGVAQERERCARVAGYNGCTSAGCDPSVEDDSLGHTLSCPVGIATAIRQEPGEGR